jgi:hypothetical protein
VLRPALAETALLTLVVSPERFDLQEETACFSVKVEGAGGAMRFPVDAQP